MDQIVDEMLTSKELMGKARISRATLNNYIALGILPKPIVKRSQKAGERSRRVGYFPPETVERIAEVQRLKQTGLTIAEIAAWLRPGPLAASKESERPAPQGVVREEAPEARAPEALSEVEKGEIKLTITDIRHPAYLVNTNFELEWWNDPAKQELFGPSNAIAPEIEARNIFAALLNSGKLRDAGNRNDILRFHLAFAKKRVSGESLAKVYPLIDSRDAELLESLYGASEPVETRPLSHARTGQAGRKEIEGYDLHAACFREGILFVYVPAGIRDDSTLEILSRRHQVIHDLLERRLPFLTHVAVLVADLQDSTRICAELPPEEYFALVNETWGSTESIFLKYHGVHGKHSGDGIVYYFFPQPDSNYVLNAIRCSHELKQQMREVSRSWRTRKNWLEELCLNIGLNEGREWFGTYPTNVEFTVLGDTINHAGRLSDFATDGSIWVTKSMLITLSTEEREQLRYGIRRRTENGDEVLVSNFYSSISEMLDPTSERYARFHAIAHLAVSEITDVLDGDTPS